MSLSFLLLTIFAFPAKIEQTKPKSPSKEKSNNTHDGKTKHYKMFIMKSQPFFFFFYQSSCSFHQPVHCFPRGNECHQFLVHSSRNILCIYKYICSHTHFLFKCIIICYKFFLFPFFPCHVIIELGQQLSLIFPYLEAN